MPKSEISIPHLESIFSCFDPTKINDPNVVLAILNYTSWKLFFNSTTAKQSTGTILLNKLSSLKENTRPITIKEIFDSICKNANETSISSPDDTQIVLLQKLLATLLNAPKSDQKKEEITQGGISTSISPELTFFQDNITAIINIIDAEIYNTSSKNGTTELCELEGKLTILDQLEKQVNKFKDEPYVFTNHLEILLKIFEICSDHFPSGACNPVYQEQITPKFIEDLIQAINKTKQPILDDIEKHKKGTFYTNMQKNMQNKIKTLQYIKTIFENIRIYIKNNPAIIRAVLQFIQGIDVKNPLGDLLKELDKTLKSPKSPESPESPKSTESYLTDIVTEIISINFPSIPSFAISFLPSTILELSIVDIINPSVIVKIFNEKLSSLWGGRLLKQFLPSEEILRESFVNFLQNDITPITTFLFAATSSCEKSEDISQLLQLYISNPHIIYTITNKVLPSSQSIPLTSLQNTLTDQYKNEMVTAISFLNEVLDLYMVEKTQYEQEFPNFNLPLSNEHGTPTDIPSQPPTISSILAKRELKSYPWKVNDPSCPSSRISENLITSLSTSISKISDPWDTSFDKQQKEEQYLQSLIQSIQQTMGLIEKIIKNPIDTTLINQITAIVKQNEIKQAEQQALQEGDSNPIRQIERELTRISLADFEQLKNSFMQEFNQLEKEQLDQYSDTQNIIDTLNDSFLKNSFIPELKRLVEFKNAIALSNTQIAEADRNIQALIPTILEASNHKKNRLTYTVCCIVHYAFKLFGFNVFCNIIEERKSFNFLQRQLKTYKDTKVNNEKAMTEFNNFRLATEQNLQLHLDTNLKKIQQEMRILYPENPLPDSITLEWLEEVNLSRKIAEKIAEKIRDQERKMQEILDTQSANKRTYDSIFTQLDVAVTNLTTYLNKIIPILDSESSLSHNKIIPNIPLEDEIYTQKARISKLQQLISRTNVSSLPKLIEYITDMNNSIKEYEEFFALKNKCFSLLTDMYDINLNPSFTDADISRIDNILHTAKTLAKELSQQIKAISSSKGKITPPYKLTLYEQYEQQINEQYGKIYSTVLQQSPFFKKLNISPISLNGSLKPGTKIESEIESEYMRQIIDTKETAIKNFMKNDFRHITSDKSNPKIPSITITENTKNDVKNKNIEFYFSCDYTFTSSSGSNFIGPYITDVFATLIANGILDNYGRLLTPVTTNINLTVDIHGWYHAYHSNEMKSCFSDINSALFELQKEQKELIKEQEELQKSLYPTAPSHAIANSRNSPDAPSHHSTPESDSPRVNYPSSPPSPILPTASCSPPLDISM